MKSIYSSPFRVYLILCFFALLGGLSGLKLPISLYPNSTKPSVSARISYGSLTTQEFIDNYGNAIESQLSAISSENTEVDTVEVDYSRSRASYQVNFKWGARPKEALREVQNTLNGLGGSWPQEIRDSLNIRFWSEGSGFIAISFFSEERGLNELYKILEPALTPKLSKVQDAENSGLFNPGRKEVSIILNAEAMATFKLFPSHIVAAINKGREGFRAGSVQIGKNNLSIQMPRSVETIKDMEELLVQTPSGRFIHLSEVAKVDYGEATDSSQVFKTNGSKSLILFASPRSGGNVKRMAEEIVTIVEDLMPSLPRDIQYRTLVDPSEFIRASISNVIHEVGVAAGLAVLVLFIFIGSFKNTITAAIEIPLSMILAFILMKLFGMNLNLISLGGLALAAGMNVDASVVTMENIFRHFEMVKGPLDYQMRMKIIIRAVREVAFPIIASTLSTLVVFAPLAFTSELTNAILGDLAKAVVFSHAFSMFIALILVPTIRLQLMGKGERVEKPSSSLLETPLRKIESIYAGALRFINKGSFVKVILGLISVSVIIAVVSLTVPKLKKEIIGTPDTDWMVLRVSTQGNTLIQQMEEKSSEIEARLLETFDKDILYTYTQIYRTNVGVIMARLKNKKEMDRVWKAMEEEFQNEPGTYFSVSAWNPAELPLPNPPDMRLIIRGAKAEDRNLYTQILKDELEEQEVYKNVQAKPSVNRIEEIRLTPYQERWNELRKKGVSFTSYDLSDLSRTATEGKWPRQISINGENFPIRLAYEKETISTKEDLAAFPISVGDKLIPLSSLVKVELTKAKNSIHKENGQEIVKLEGRKAKGKEAEKEESLALARKILRKLEGRTNEELGLKERPIALFEDADKELNQALGQLKTAIFLSIGLIFLTLLLQFGSLIHSLIIMVAIPFGVAGGAFSLWLFESTLSLNSVLGIILLNGIAVNNSIILVDFILSSYEEGMTPLEAAILAGRKRLRPILITSLTTILGMLPIAIGSGDGGKILQPLGLAVAGGLWFSTFFTLFAVPSLEVSYLNWRRRKDFKKLELRDSETGINKEIISNRKSTKEQSDEVELQ